MNKDEKLKSLSSAIEQIEKSHGKGSIMKLGNKEIPKVDVVSTQSLSLDIALGIGGLPKGRIVEIFGEESSGKTTTCLHVIAEAQKLGGYCAFIDTEHALDLKYAGQLGVNVEELLLSQPEYGEQALEIAEILIRSNAVSVVVIDSVASLVPRSELEGEMGDAQMGVQARLMSQALRKLTRAVSTSGTILIFTNQMRDKIGVMFGSPRTTTGGKALKFYASVRLDVKRSTQVKDGTEVLGNLTTVKVVKNKMAPPFKEAKFDIIYGQGISKLGEIIDLAVEMEIIKKSGAWFSYKDQRFQGRDGIKNALSPEQLLEIENEIRLNAGLSVATTFEVEKTEEKKESKKKK